MRPNWAMTKTYLIGIHFKDFSHSFNEVLATQAVKTLKLGLTSRRYHLQYYVINFDGHNPRFVVSYSPVFTKSFPFPFRVHNLLHHCWSSGWSDTGRGAGGTNFLLQEEDIQEERRENEYIIVIWSST